MEKYLLGREGPLGGVIQRSLTSGAGDERRIYVAQQAQKVIRLAEWVITFAAG
ncbi:MAG: hypothetical protein R3C14_35515 [Caldilineaceae bacterium]